jgi:hypothetical protein
MRSASARCEAGEEVVEGEEEDAAGDGPAAAMGRGRPDEEEEEEEDDDTAAALAAGTGAGFALAPRAAFLASIAARTWSGGVPFWRAAMSSAVDRASASRRGTRCARPVA